MPLLDAHSIPGVNLNFAEVHAAMVMPGSPIAYVKEAWPGELFCPVRCPNGRVGSDVICSVDSNFFPDRKETFRALAWLQNQRRWPSRPLDDRHEFLLVFESSRLERSRFLSLTRLALTDTVDAWK